MLFARNANSKRLCLVIGAVVCILAASETIPATSAATRGTSAAPAAGSFSDVESLVGSINSKGGTLDPNFTLASTVGWQDGTIKIWTSTGVVSDALIQEAKVAGFGVDAAKAVLTRAQINAIESDATGLSRAGSVLGTTSKVLGVDVDFTGPVKILVDQVTTAATDAALQRYASYGADAIVLDKAAPPTFFARQDDTSPFYSGARIDSANTGGYGASCSSGFTAYSYTNGAKYILTSEHCVNRFDKRFWMHGGVPIGSVTGELGQYDIAAIKVQADADSRMYTGDWAASSYVQVTQRASPANNTRVLVCTSGAFSGYRCPGSYLDGYLHYGQWCTASGACFDDLVLWHVTPNNLANTAELAGQGDSGGPTILDPAHTHGPIVAVGAVEGSYATHVPCVGIAGPVCTNGMLMTDMNLVADIWNLSYTY